ncbi:Gfo/Idh/MocA family oxidoreductase [Microbacterium sp.]|uniref:Gfo/Idh/MocA family protein n=1 Tax=Microbacterium sp. TaxID=51671 RepID=UPI0028B005D6|nr:Gfo/Idh/MocA family oxidoreductase [Microbacterium sp.]
MKSTLRVGIVGAGGIAPVHIEGWMALGADVAILRRTDAGALADRYGIRIIGGLDELIDAVDVVDIISPTSTHLEIARAAFARGRHVVCEKPLAASAADARALIDAADDAGVRLFPAHVVRYFEGYRDLHERIGSVGTLAELTFRRTVGAPDSAWFYAEDAGGGVIRDLMIHDIDQALWLAGSVVEVTATQDPPGVADRVSPPVSAHVTLTHANGAITHLRADWLEPGTPFRSTAEVAGSDGILRVDTDVDPADADPYRAQLADFAAAIRTGGEARVTAADGLAAVAVVDAAYASLAGKRPITF